VAIVCLVTKESNHAKNKVTVMQQPEENEMQLEPARNAVTVTAESDLEFEQRDTGSSQINTIDDANITTFRSTKLPPKN